MYICEFYVYGMYKSLVQFSSHKYYKYDFYYIYYYNKFFYVYKQDIAVDI